MNAPAPIAAIVVSHENATTIADCVTSLLVSEGVGVVVVVDNASSDATVEILGALLAADPRLRLVCNTRNVGFARACNQGAAYSDLPWLALVNPDCVLEPSQLQRLLAHADSRPDAGLLGTGLVDASGRPDPAARRRAPNLANLLAGRGGRGSLWVEADASLPLQPVEAVSGALMLMPRALFEVLGGFDEDYRMHAEDLDLCRRIRDAGHGIYVANDINVLHLRGVSSRSRPLWVEYHKHRGLWRYLRKFELRDAAAPRRWLAWLLVWGRFVRVAPSTWLRARRVGLPRAEAPRTAA